MADENFRKLGVKMNFKTFLRGIQLGSLIALAGMLGGCMTPYRQGDPNFEAVAGKTVYGLVRGIRDASTTKFGAEYCNFFDNRDPECSHLSDYNHVSVAIGRSAWRLEASGMLVPKTEHVQKGDVIVYRAATVNQAYNKFLRIAAHAADTDRLHCGWVGSKIAFSGGVVCDGWRYDKDYPLLAH